MSEIEQKQSDDLMQFAAEIVAAYVSNNSVPATSLPGLISSVHSALVGLGGPAASEVAPEVEKPNPAQVRKSVAPDHIVSFLDGRSYKTMKRHLATHGLDPHSYRERYGLPSDYPMVAADYAAQRSALAKQIGLGRPGGRADDESDASEAKARDRKAA